MKKRIKKYNCLLLAYVFILVYCITSCYMTAKAEENVFIVYANVPEGWDNPCIWAWDDDGNNPEGFAWPGGKIIADEGNEGWYYYYLPNTMNHVIINGNDGEVQTKDYEVDSMNMWVTVKEVADDNADLDISYDAKTTGDLPEYVAPVAEEQTPVLVYVNVSDEWKNPCVWAWDDDGVSAFESWPGGKLTADENNAGWYYTYIPSTMTNIIVNANEGGVQTEGDVIEASNMWITIKDTKAEISYEQQTTGELPAYEEMITVSVYCQNGWSEVNLWAWNAEGKNAYEQWPGSAAEQVADGWFSVKAPGWIENIIVNTKNGDEQTADIPVESGKDIYVVISEDNTSTVYYEKPDMSEKFTVHAKVAEDWTFPCIWSWSHPDGTNVFVNWPGDEMVLAEDGWYEYQLPVWVNRLIINANMGGVQTEDIEIDAKELWVTIDSEGVHSVNYEAPDTDAVAQETNLTSADDNTGFNPAVVVVSVIVFVAAATGTAVVVKKKKAA